ncbi:hypothetical protein [Actinoplanes awajinensis]|nr:hypothetical protein [Actinoplanes awajinensis]
MSRRIGTIFALATAAAGMATTVAATPATAAPAAPRGPQPTSMWLKPVQAGAASWVDIAWRTDRNICDAQVQVRGERVRVDYAGNRRSAMFLRGAALSTRRGDVTRIRVTPDRNLVGVTKLWATISYDDCGRRARTQTRTTVLSLPVLRSTSPGGHGGPGAPGTGHPGGPTGQGNHGNHNQGGAHPGGGQPGGGDQGGSNHGGPGQGGGHH